MKPKDRLDFLEKNKIHKSDISTGKSGFMLISIMILVLLAFIIFSSGRYIGEQMRDTSSENTEMISREIDLFIDEITDQYRLHNKYRNEMISTGVSRKSAIDNLWLTTTISGLLGNGNKYSLLQLASNKPKHKGVRNISLTVAINEQEQIPISPAVNIPSLISVELVVNTVDPLYDQVINEKIHEWLKKNHVVEARFSSKIDPADTEGKLSKRQITILLKLGSVAGLKYPVFEM